MCFDCWYVHKHKNDNTHKQHNEYYVYAWYKPHEKHPFYIGKGKNNRMNGTHYVANVPAYCQRVWDANPGCKVEIIKSNLSEQEALKLEKNLISEYRQMGVLLANMTR